MADKTERKPTDPRPAVPPAAEVGAGTAPAIPSIPAETDAQRADRLERELRDLRGQLAAGGQPVAVGAAEADPEATAAARHDALAAAVVTRLKSRPVTAMIVSDRVYLKGEVPDGAATPHLVVSKGRDRGRRGGAGPMLSQADVHVESVGADPQQVMALAPAAQLALSGYTDGPKGLVRGTVLLDTGPIAERDGAARRIDQFALFHSAE